MAKDIPESRKIAYYSGGALMILGIVLFLSVLLGGGPDAKNFRDFEKESDSMARRAMIGMVFIGVGAIIRNIAQRGLAGSGMVLDPEQARKDLEPFSRQTGGMAKDALDEAGILPEKLTGHTPAPAAIKVRCRACKTLNDETAKFCMECGSKI